MLKYLLEKECEVDHEGTKLLQAPMESVWKKCPQTKQPTDQKFFVTLFSE